MASIQTRSSVLAIKKEITEGTPVLPTVATDYVALQDTFAMEGGFALLDNAEMKSSIGMSKKIIGAEAPTASLDHYLRHSGVEGQAPNYGVLLEAALGAVSIASTEYPTVAASTTSVIKVNTGIGASFERGEALLIKDATNGYRIRCIESVAGDNLTIGFQVPVAPAVSVNLGKCVLYKPANTGHPTLSLFHYLGNGGATQALAGGRVTSAAISISAGELINASYSIEGVSYYFDPIEVVTGASIINFNDGAPKTASIPLKLYKSPIELADAIALAFTAAHGAAVACTYSSTTGKFTVSQVASIAITWLTGANSIGATLGFTADVSAIVTSTSNVAISFASPQTPSFDNSDPLAAKDNEVMLGIGSDVACFAASTVTYTIDTPKADIMSVCSVSGKQGSVIQSRACTIAVNALLEKYDASEFERFRVGTEIKFQYSFGVKSAGNWVAGKSGALFAPTASISKFVTADNNGLVELQLELTAFVNNAGSGEVFISFV